MTLATQFMQQGILKNQLDSPLLNVTCIVEEDVDKKIDTNFVQATLAGIQEKTAIIFVCVNDDWRKDDSWRKKGTRYHRIIMPYEQVKGMSLEEVRELMLKMAKERLQPAKKKSAPDLQSA